MNRDNNFETFTEAYLNLIADVLNKGSWVEGTRIPNSIGSNFGEKTRRTKELLVYSFSLSNPRQRNLFVENRFLRRPYLLANFLWALSGTKKGNAIIAFNDKGKHFLNDKDEFNSAIGPHIFRMRKNLHYYLSEIENLLREDPSTRRAVFQFLSQKDITSNSKDVPCYNHMQLFIREGRLHAHVVMRSQNALMVLPYDFFFFSLFHEAMAVRLNLNLGTLFYTANSLHIYEDFIDLASTIRPVDAFEEPKLMSNFSDQTIKKLRSIFTLISSAQQNGGLEAIVRILNAYHVDDYWDNLLLSHFAGEQTFIS